MTIARQPVDVHAPIMARCPYGPEAFRWECPCGAHGIWQTDEDRAFLAGADHAWEPEVWWEGYARGLARDVQARPGPPSPKIDAYRIGYGPVFRHVQMPWLRWRSGVVLRDAWKRDSTSACWGPSRDRWRRCWQAEWEGCRRAPRAWTRRGVLRKARRLQGLW